MPPAAPSFCLTRILICFGELRQDVHKTTQSYTSLSLGLCKLYFYNYILAYCTRKFPRFCSILIFFFTFWWFSVSTLAFHYELEHFVLLFHWKTSSSCVSKVNSVTALECRAEICDKLMNATCGWWIPWVFLDSRCCCCCYLKAIGLSNVPVQFNAVSLKVFSSIRKIAGVILISKMASGKRRLRRRNAPQQQYNRLKEFILHISIEFWTMSTWESNLHLSVNAFF